RPDASLVGVFDLAHLGDGVGEVDDALGGVATGEDDVGALGSFGDRRDDPVDVDPAPVEGVGDLVEDDQAMVAGGDQLLGLLPRRGGDGLVEGEVLGQPGEALALGPPVDAELTADLLLTGVPGPRLEELDDGDGPAAADAANDDAHGGGGLALTVAGVDEDERRGASQIVGTGILGRDLLGVTFGHGGPFSRVRSDRIGSAPVGVLWTGSSGGRWVGSRLVRDRSRSGGHDHGVATVVDHLDVGPVVAAEFTGLEHLVRGAGADD